MTKATPDSIRAERDRALARIRSRRDLTQQARQVSIARAHQDAERKMAALLEENKASYQRQRDFLERKLFGGDDSTGAGAMSARDAREKAAAITDPREAQAAFQRAQRAGDTDMVKALAAHAAEQAGVTLLGQAWQPIVAAYAESSPGKADTYKQLTELHEPDTGSDWSYALDTPTELGRLSAGQVMQLAGADLEVHGNDAA
ncbi:hypothetical protein ACIQU3_14275 [Streptomyces sp. NPDC101110]|uniref:hypothetical protein n=1 Tax=Streptomyces sp. NPDC101110 TaxID=3366104 RepID=UPI00380B7D3A